MTSTKHKQSLPSQDIIGSLEEIDSGVSFGESECTIDSYGERVNMTISMRIIQNWKRTNRIN
jgi:hypothetical protein